MKPRSLPHIVVDARMVGPVGHGISTYVTQMIDGFRRLDRTYQLSFLTRGLDSRFSKIFEGFRTVPTQSRFLSPREWFELPRILHRVGADLFHSPSFMALPFTHVPTIFTVHDLNHIHWGNFSKKIYYQTVLRKALRKAPAIMTVSQFSKQELERWLEPESHAPVEVIENAVDASYLDSGTGSSPTGTEYFLCVTNSKAHKRWDFLLSAYQKYRKLSRTPLPLVTTVVAQADGVRSLGPMPQSELRGWVGHARAVFFPSAYEGFGLPPLEASISGTPAFVSNIPVHREALRNFSRIEWVPVDLESAWIEAFFRAERGEGLRPLESERAKAVEVFSAARLGREVDQVYRRVLGL